MIRTIPVPVCPLCAREGGALYTGVRDRNHFVAGEWTIRQCLKCSIGWLDPQPVPEDIALTYASEYYTHSGEAEPVSLGRNTLWRALRGAVLSSRYGYVPLRPQIPLADLLGHLLSLHPTAHLRATLGWLRAVPPFHPKGRLLEIGCGDGNYLVAMRELGWEVHGIEPDPVAAERAAAASGAKIWAGTIETAQVPGTFQAVISHHCIEHVYDPGIFVNRAAGLLCKGGFLYIVTPNLNSLARRMFHKDWLALDVPRHLNLSTPESLRSLCEKSGMLRVESVRTLTRRARREREHVCAVRQTGGFNSDFKPGIAQSAAIRLFSMAEKAGNPFFQWGEEVELTAFRV